MRGKYLKLLCFLIISFFIIGFGGEVKAEVFYSKGTLNYRPETYFQQFYPSNNANIDAYCINSSKAAPSGYNLTLMNGLIPDYARNGVINILRASQTLNLSAGERYYVTQAAIWYTIYGISYCKTCDGITQGFYNWISTRYSTSWNTLMNARTNVLGSPSLSIGGTDFTLETDGEYLVSKDFSINSQNISGTFNVKIDSGSDGACILYNGNCTTSVDVPGDASFKVRVDTPSSNGEVNARFTVKANTNPASYDLLTYGGLYSSGFQNIVMLTTTSQPISKSQVVKGNYEDTPIDVEVQKIDVDTGKKVAGATLYITDENGSKIGEFISTAEGEANPKVSLPEGNYKLEEYSQPQGYYYNKNTVVFSVVKEGTSLVVKDASDNTISAPVTISFSNKRVPIKFRKVDEQGNPIEGVKFEISASGSGDQSAKTLCAYSDAEGYLTRLCNGETTDGVYTVGIDFGKNGSFHSIHETCESDSCKQYYKGGMGANDFWINNNQVIVYRKNLSVSTSDDGDYPTINIIIKNEHYINISKVDVTGGDEIAGATLRVTDPSITSGDNVIDEWVSTTTSKDITGIVPGHKYRLTEILPSEGYTNIIDFVRNVNSIDFIMDEDGNVTTYDIISGEEITDLTGTEYELLIKNDYTKTVFSKTSAVSGKEIAGSNLKVCTEASYNAAKDSTGDGNNCTPDKPEWSWTSEEGKTYTIEALSAGSYYLIEELAPEGYVKQTNAANFEVKADGTITKVEMKNEPTKVVISKKDITTGEEVPGATIKICTLDDYKKDGSDCKPGREDLEWVSGTESKKIEALPFGDYVLIETLPSEGYDEGMIIDGNLMTAYEFTISQENNNIKIDVYNQLLTNVPSTGISTLNLFAIGGLMVFAGYETIKIYRRKALNN